MNPDLRAAIHRYIASRHEIAAAQHRMVAASIDATVAFQRFGMAWAAIAIEEADLGEFDNRAHDWLTA